MHRLIVAFAVLVLTGTANAHLPKASSNSSGNTTFQGNVTHDGNTVTVESDATFTTACSTNDCGVTLKENSSNPSAPSAGDRFIHCKSDGCYILENSGTATPGDKISTGGGSNPVTLSARGAQECKGGTRYFGMLDIGCDTTEGQVAGVPFNAAWTATELCCTIAENAATDCDLTFTTMDNGTAATDLQVSITDAGSGCDSGSVAFSTTDTWSIRVVEGGSTSCGSNTRVGCVVRGAFD